MKPIKSKLALNRTVGRLLAGCAVAAGFAMAAIAPAMADDWHHGHHDHNGGGVSFYYNPGPVYVQPRPIIVRPAPVYYAPQPYYYEPQPVYYAPPPPPVYYRPAPVYYGPSVNVVVPLRFH